MNNERRGKKFNIFSFNKYLFCDIDSFFFSLSFNKKKIIKTENKTKATTITIVFMNPQTNKKNWVQNGGEVRKTTEPERGVYVLAARIFSPFFCFCCFLKKKTTKMFRIELNVIWW